MPLSKEQLLLPRYRVKASYPKMSFQLGEIIEYTSRMVHVSSESTSNENSDIFTSFSMPFSELKKYPAIFRELHWSDNRLKGEFPEYVLFDKTCVPAKVLSVKCDEAGFVTEIETDAEPEEYYRADIWDFPATQEEYDAYQQSKWES